MTVDRRAISWLPLAAPATPLPALASCRTVSVSGDASVDAGEFVAALRGHGLTLAPADRHDAEVLVLFHGLGADPPRAGFAELTAVAARPVHPRVLVAVARDDPDGAAFGALVRTAALEWSAEWKCVTLGPRAEAAIDVPREIARGGADREVRLGGERSVRIRVAAAAGGAARPLSEGPWIVSGGARGVTAACAIALARAGARRIALLGRTRPADEPAGCRDAHDEAALKRVLVAAAGGRPDLAAIGRRARAILASREIAATIAALRAAGADVRYDAVDVADSARIADLVADLRRSWGPIRGLVHGAGVIADRRLGEKTADQFDAVLRAKIAGAHALLGACAGDSLEQICFFSSVAAHAGNPGQADYAAANAALDRLALDEQARRGAACHVVSIAWGPWAGGMVTDALARHFTARGIALIPLQAGARAFVDELRRGNAAQVMIGSGLGPVRADVPEPLRFDLGAMPILRDHAIGGAPVLPMTIALDVLFGGGRRALGHACEARDVRLLQGVVFGGDVAELELRAEPGPDGASLLTLTHASGRPAYRAEFAAAEGPPPACVHLASDGSALPEACRDPYAAALFHGPAFQVIREVLTCTDRAIGARVATATTMGWPAGWQIDPAALDGALQLLRLWGYAHDGRASLPTAIGRCRPWRRWPADGEVGCIVSCRRDRDRRITGDALFVDLQTGGPLLSLDGIVMHTQA